MLRVTITENGNEQKILLEGELAGRDLAELKTAWNSHRASREGRRCIVNLNGVTLIDRNGESMLMEMRREGAEFVASGVATKYQLESLGILEGRPSEEPSAPRGRVDDRMAGSKTKLNHVA